MDKFKAFRLIAALACLVLTLALTSVGSVRAAPSALADKIMSAADFAAACNTNLGFTISADTIVTGGSGTINPYACRVHLSPDVSLTFDQVSLDSPKGSNAGLLVDGGNRSQVHIHQSTMVMDGGLFLEPGGHEPGGVDGNGALLEVSQSTLRSTYASGEVRLLASSCTDGGSVRVTQSEVSAPSAVYISAGLTDPAQGCPGSNGMVQVSQSAITASLPQGLILILTGKGGQTSALQNTFAAGTGIAGGASCKALYNIPDTPCS